MRVLELAEAAVAEMMAGEQTAQSNYHRLLVYDDQERSQRILKKAGVVIAGLSAADTTTGGPARLLGGTGRGGRGPACTYSGERGGSRRGPAERWRRRAHILHRSKEHAEASQQAATCAFTTPAMACRPPLHTRSHLAAARSRSRAMPLLTHRSQVVGLATSELTVAKLTERHFARTAVRSSLLGALLSPPARPSRLPTTSSAR